VRRDKIVFDPSSRSYEASPRRAVGRELHASGVRGLHALDILVLQLSARYDDGGFSGGCARSGCRRHRWCHYGSRDREDVA